MNRRTALRTAALAAGAVAVGIAADAFLIEPYRLEVTRRDLPLEHLPPALAGRTLLHLGDIHVGRDVSARYLEHAFQVAARLEPDVVAFSGDFISYHSAHDLAELARVLRSFPHGRLATVASLGNHDYGDAWRQMDVANQVARVASDAGIRVLRNEVVAIAGLQVAGLADFWSPEFGPAGGAQPDGVLEPGRDRPGFDAGDARDAIRAIAPGAPTVILSHNPDVQDEPLWDGVRGYVLAGHTHGGQLKPPFLPPPILPVRNRRYVQGEFALAPGRRMYITRGVGNIHHVRFNVRPEMTLFTLRHA